MTGYQTAEQTAAPHQYPAGIPATPHLAYLGLLLALLATCIIPTSAAEIEVIDIYDYEIESITKDQTGYRELSYAVAEKLDWIYVKNIETFQNPYSIIWTQLPTRTRSFELYNTSIFADNTPVTFHYKTVSGPIIGTGDLSYYRDPAGITQDYIVVTFDEFNSSVIGDDTGEKVLHITDKKPDWNMKWIRFDRSNYPSDYFVDFHFTGSYTTNLKTEFKHRVEYTTVDDYYTNISVIRSNNGSFESRVIISGQDGLNPYSDTTHASNPVSVSVPNYDAPFTISVYSTALERWYNRTILQSAPPPDNSSLVPVTIQIRSTDTGDLIPGSHITIHDSLIGEVAISEDLTSGSEEYFLEKAHTLRYLASATAEEHSPLFPIQFGTGDSGTTIVLWMYPSLPPDDPIEDGKSMLYGYVLTTGSQQPIPGAIVTLSNNVSTTTTSTGFYIFNNVTPSTFVISATAPLHDTLSEPVTVDAAPTQHNLALKGHYLLTVTVKDGDTLANLHNATISLSDGQESTQNPATFPADYGPYTITAAAGGYYPQTQSAYLDKPGTTTATVLLTERPPPATPAEMPNYPQHNVRFLCVDEYNHPLQNVTITAVYQESSGPVSWITDWLGLSQNVHVANSTLQGTTGLDGSVIFLMVQSVQYRFTVAAPDLNMTQTFDLYPKEDEITIRFVTSDRPDLSTMPTYDLTATETDPSSVRLALSYHDATNATTALTFTVTDHATGELIHTETFAASKFPGTVSPSYTVENTKGAMYRFGFEATNTVHGPISQYKGITLNGDGLLVDLGFEDRNLYAWLAVILMFLFAGAFSGTNVKQGAILVPLFGGGLFWYIGWLPIALGAVISAIAFLGVLVYMRKSEWKVRS